MCAVGLLMSCVTIPYKVICPVAANASIVYVALPTLLPLVLSGEVSNSSLEKVDSLPSGTSCGFLGDTTSYVR